MEVVQSVAMRKGATAMGEACRIVADPKAAGPLLTLALMYIHLVNEGARISDDQIKHMVDRFLGWRLPEDFHPDGGVQFDPDGAKKLDPRNLRYAPYGTNLLDATQAEAMVRHMLDGLPS